MRSTISAYLVVPTWILSFLIASAPSSTTTAFTAIHHGNKNSPTIIETKTRQGASSPLCAASPQSQESQPSNDTTTTTCRSPLDNAKRAASTFAVASFLMFSTCSVDPPSSHAYDGGDFASDKVTIMIRTLQECAGNREKSFAAYEELAQMITEGKDIGGSVSPGGVKFERGYVSDEDTTIYNPGLSLLTESEKTKLLDAVMDNKKVSVQKNAWSRDNQVGFDFLRSSLDPLHMNELRGYLGVFPYYAAVVYLVVLFVQQNLRDFFSTAYIVGALALFVPVLVLSALGG